MAGTVQIFSVRIAASWTFSMTFAISSSSFESVLSRIYLQTAKLYEDIIKCILLAANLYLTLVMY